MDFIICTPEVNRYNYRVLPEGVRTDNFQKNPVALWMHDTNKLPVGRWENLRIEDGNLVGTAVFASDETGQRLKQLAEDRILSAVSMGFIPIAHSDEPDMAMPGQSYATVTDAELYEISFVTVPGNPGAVRLLQLSGAGVGDADVSILPPLKQNLDEMNEKFLQALGLEAKTGDDAALAAIEKLKADAAKAQALQVQAVTALMAAGRAKGIVTDENEAHYARLAAADLEAVNQLFSLSAPAAPAQEAAPEAKPDAKAEASYVSLTQALQVLAAKKIEADPKAAWGFDDWSKQDPAGLLAMKKADPERYAALAAAKAAAAGVA
jgi:HK97 family phage prohead protease